jgi:Tol biopolymer transport system component
MAAILKEDPPDLTASGVAIPPALDRLLRRCLEKNPDERFQSARDLAFAIEAVDGSSASTTISGTAAVPSRSILPSRVGLMATAAVALAAAAFGGWWFGSQRGQTAVTRWDQFAQLTDEAGEEATPRISPDGASFAYASRAKGSWDIYVQRVGGRQPIPVAADSSRHERWPAFSPDGKTIAFNETDGDGGIFIIGATGESERRLTDFGANPAWSPDGRTIVFAAEEVDMPYIRNGISSLWIVDVSGGAPRQLTKEDAVQPIFSPSGRRIAFWQAVAGQRDLVTMAADGTDRVKVTDDAPLDFAPAWSPDGRYLYFASDRGGSMGLWRVGIDESTGRAAGALESVSAGVEAWMDMPSFSADGSTLLFRSRLESVNPTAIPFDPVAERAGTPKMLVSRTGVLNPTSVSRDGLWLALCNQGEAKEDLFVMRTDGTGLRRLTDDAARDRQPRWAPDDKTLLFYSNREGHYGAWSIRSDGSGLTRLTAPTGFDLFYASLSPADGTMLITGDQGESFLATPPFPVGKDRFRKIQNIDVAGGLLQPSLWSPDGRYISGPVVARATSAPIGVGVYDVVAGKAWKLTDDGGLWSLPFLPDSKRIIYLTSASELVVVDVATGKRRVISVTLPFPVGVEAFTVAPDGRTLYYGARRVEANVWKVSGGKQ